MTKSNLAVAIPAGLVIAGMIALPAWAMDNLDTIYTCPGELGSHLDWKSGPTDDEGFSWTLGSVRRGGWTNITTYWHNETHPKFSWIRGGYAISADCPEAHP